MGEKSHSRFRCEDLHSLCHVSMSNKHLDLDGIERFQTYAWTPQILPKAS